MELSPARSRLSELIARHETNMTELSRDVLGKNPAYIQQYIARGQPRKLDEDARNKLASFFDTSPDLFKDDAANNETHKTEVMKLPTITVDELDVQAAAGAGAIVEDNPIVARWTLSRGSLRSIGSTQASDLKIIQVIGDSMAPTFFPGQKVLVDVSHRMPSHPGIYIVWDGMGLLVKRVEHIPNSRPTRVRIFSDNRAYTAWESDLEDANIQGRVVGAWAEY